MATVDVTVMGAGVFGLSVAYACLQRGAQVQVIDPNGVAAGASGGIVGALAPHVPEQWNPKKAFQLESLLMAETYWRGVSDVSGKVTGYARSGRLQPLADEAAVALARRRGDTARDLWGDHAVWEVREAPDGWAPPSATGLVIWDSLSGLIHPRQATQALAAAVVALGGRIEEDGKPAGRVVWATGVQGLEEMTAQHTRQIGNGVKGQAALLGFAAVGQPQLYADGLHIVPHGDGTVAIGSTTERYYDAPANLWPTVGSRSVSAWHRRWGRLWLILFWTGRTLSPMTFRRRRAFRTRQPSCIDDRPGRAPMLFRRSSIGLQSRDP